MFILKGAKIEIKFEKSEIDYLFIWLKNMNYNPSEG